MKTRALISSLIALIAISAIPAAAQTPVRINWTAVTGAQSGMFMAKQEGLFKKNGLDVELIHIPSSSRGMLEVPNIFTALAAGQIEAGVVSPPTNARAKKAGFVELMNIAKEGPEFVSVAVGTSRAYIKANEDVVRRVVRSYAEGIQIFKTNKPAALKMFQNQLKVKEAEILEDTYNQFREYLEYPPYVTRKAMEAVLNDIAANDPAAKSAKPEDFMDMRFVAELDKKAGGK